MTYSTIYYMDTAETATDGAPTGHGGLILARNMAKREHKSVIVEDHGAGETYRVTPAGHIWRAPKSFLSIPEA